MGRRVTLRYRTHAGEGEPALTDVVGELLEWDQSTLRVRRRDGAVVEVRAADLVAGRVVLPPPRGHPR